MITFTNEEKAREICAMALSQKYEKYALLLDRLEGSKYLSFWQGDGLLLVVTGEDILNERSPVIIHEHKKVINKKYFIKSKK